MRAVIQRVGHASVTIKDQVVGRVNRGLLVLLGVTHEDDIKDAQRLAEKIAGLRIFEDEAGKMNLGLQDVNGSMLVVSQFTLYADCRKGRRPSFVAAATPDKARMPYQEFVQAVRALGIEVQTGEFGGEMQVELVNDGPVTIVLDSKELS